jgi:FixJ family two-component response regulator
MAMKRGAYDFLPKPFTPEELRLIKALSGKVNSEPAAD